jgi:hypothetical protein
MRNIRIGWILAIALGAVAGIYLGSCDMDNAPEAATRELHFYQTDPPCENAKVGYLLLSGTHYAVEQHRVFVCGYAVGKP